MKKTALVTVLFVFVAVALISCGKSDNPAAPAPTPVPVSAYTYAALATVPGGTFTQAPGFDHTVSAFKIGKYEVTYEIWRAVYVWAGTHGYTFQNPGREGDAGTIDAAPSTTTAKNKPVTTISWRDMIVWCNAYSEKEGLTPVYCSDAGFTTALKDSSDGAFGSSVDTTPGSLDNPYVNWAATGYRLPTEGEWQYAASYIDGASWTPYDYASGATANYLDSAATMAVAWYSANNTGGMNPVGGKNANALQVYDMSGNAWEFTWDWTASYPTSTTDYRGPASGTMRLGRGGYYLNNANQVVVNYRNGVDPFYEGTAFSFRVAKK